MRNCTLRIVKHASLFSLLIITLSVFPRCKGCKSENLDNVPSLQGAGVPRQEEIIAEETWGCLDCGNENEQHLTTCQQCNVDKHRERCVQPQEPEKEADKPQGEKLQSQDSEIDELDKDGVSSEKEECPVCCKKFPKEQATYRYFTCLHFLCEKCYGEIKTRSEKGKQPLRCPLCRNDELL